MQVKRKALHDTVSDGSDEDQVNAKPVGKVKKQAEEDMQGLYLDTINRNVLDFDFERVCSVSLSNLNVYACLVCGKYFQGKEYYRLLILICIKKGEVKPHMLISIH